MPASNAASNATSPLSDINQNGTLQNSFSQNASPQDQYILQNGDDDSEDVLALSALLLRSDLAGARQLVISKRLNGVPLAAINLNLLAPTARHLGVLWERDECDFNAVTLTVANLQILMRELAKLANDDIGQGGHHHRVLLAPVENEDHTFGLSMLGDFFGREGWDVWGGPGTTAKKLMDLASAQSFDIVGLSIADERWLDDAASTITALRNLSQNQELKILLGGPLLITHPELAVELGADGTASTAPEALSLANSLVSAVQQSLVATRR